MDSDPESVIDLDLDKLVYSKELIRECDIVILAAFALITISVKYIKIYFTFLSVLYFLYNTI